MIIERDDRKDDVKDIHFHCPGTCAKLKESRKMNYENSWKRRENERRRYKNKRQ